ncbi:hypothetical protein FB558_8494 [Pseudonocardia kunmingensis]|uniref:Uncharacterized protein n=1 Tax=Pseudonocardia kunmingensis TaxID=630975 RepID=A0A543CWW2_9PSEU|nr:hypothetical protein FB558_8494 [Pseudonocardia kunmingensis]
MSRIHPGRAPARSRHGDTAHVGSCGLPSSTHGDHDVATLPSTSVPGFCMPCYDQGRGNAVLAAHPDGSLCRFHLHADAVGPGDVEAPIQTSPPPLRAGLRAGSRSPRGRAARSPAPRDPRPRQARTTQRGTAISAARATKRRLSYGRARAADRLRSGRYQPHPGWRHFLEPGWTIIKDQATAIRVITDLVAKQNWRSDRAAAWTAILHQLVCCMDWETGLITALTLERLGAAGARATRTVSRVLAWAREQGLVVVVEPGASAQFLGTPHGRTPTYALTTTTPLKASELSAEPALQREDHQVSSHSDQHGDPSPCLGWSNKPLTQNRLDPSNPAPQPWPVWRVPKTAPERISATKCLFTRLGLDRGGVSGRAKIPLWRAVRLLRPWWDAGWSPRGLVYAIDHHPDAPDRHRGDAMRGVHQPLAVLGYRLAPWRDRAQELPAHLVGHRHDVDDRHPATSPPAAGGATSAGYAAANTSGTARAARAAIQAHLDALATRRSGASRECHPRELSRGGT